MIRQTWWVGVQPLPHLPHPDPSFRSCSLHYYRPTLTYILVALGGLLLATLCWTREMPMLLPLLDEHGEIQKFSSFKLFSCWFSLDQPNIDDFSNLSCMDGWFRDVYVGSCWFQVSTAIGNLGWWWMMWISVFHRFTLDMDRKCAGSYWISEWRSTRRMQILHFSCRAFRHACRFGLK